MNVAVVVATHGSERWCLLADEHALPSAQEAGAAQVVRMHRDDLTLAEVRNLAATEADPTIDWLCFLDADDQLAPGYLPAMAEAWGDPPSVAAAASEPWPLLLPYVQYVANSRHTAWPALPAAGRLVAEINAGVIGTLVPRRLFDEVGGFREWAMYEDWELWLRCIRAGATLVSVPDAVYLADGTPGRNTEQALVQETYRAIRAEHADHVHGVRWPT